MEHYYKTFVSIGNAKQNFSRLLHAVQDNIALLPQPILIQAGHTPFTSGDCTVVDFINMDTFVNYVNQAKVLILHAGAGSVLHAIRAGKCPIIMPRTEKHGEHVNDHQVAFAKALQAEGKAYMIEQGNELPVTIKKVVDHPVRIEKPSSKALDLISKLLADFNKS